MRSDLPRTACPPPGTTPCPGCPSSRLFNSSGHGVLDLAADNDVNQGRLVDG